MGRSRSPRLLHSKIRKRPGGNNKELHHSKIRKRPAAKKRGLNGQRAHAVQIGLGTFGTIVENLVGEKDERDKTIGWMLRSTSWYHNYSHASSFRGVAVEPVAEHIQRLSKFAAQLPHVRLVNAALGEEEAEGAEIHVLTQDRYKALLRSVPESQRAALGKDLTYLRNMSCIGCPHPNFKECRHRIWRKYGVDVRLESHSAEVWSYGRLARQLDFRGCEVLMVDAEGHDTKILRSMIEYCSEREAEGFVEWPEMIACETAGHCDYKEGHGNEAAILEQLQHHGYLVFMTHQANTNLVFSRFLEDNQRLNWWFRTIYCYECGSPDDWPLTYGQGELFCPTCVVDAKRKWEEADAAREAMWAARREAYRAAMMKPAAARKPWWAWPGDWTCPACQDHQFSNNDVCRSCKTPKPDPMESVKASD